ncbi:MAG: polysaccharide deacetylase family protein [Clostridiales Family XIII bacterium]|nr:polysaccharide deacetylase family protein [Clostridiales Family XIII bacterium]
MNTKKLGREYIAVIALAALVVFAFAGILIVSWDQNAVKVEDTMTAANKYDVATSGVAAGYASVTDVDVPLASAQERGARPDAPDALPGNVAKSDAVSEVYVAAAAEDAYAPAVKSLSLDADELLFGRLGAKLKLEAELQPEGAYTGDLKYKSSDESVAVVNSNGTVSAEGWGTCVVTLRSGGKKATCKVTVAKKWVALTFDDGPGKYTNKLLNAMDKQGVRATFFVVGQMAKPRASLLKKMVKNGNEVANHTYAHNGKAGVLMGALKKTDKIVKKATGENTALMRPPGGAINKATRKCGKPIILWSVDPKDWRDRNSNTVYRRVMGGVKSGSIVLMHDIHPTTVNAAIRIMKSLEKKGYAFVTVSELLRNPKDNKVYNKGPKRVRTMKITY